MSFCSLYDWKDVAPERRAAWLNRQPEEDPSVIGACRDIIERVRTEGDRALIEFTRRFDGVELSPDRILVSREELEEGAAEVDATMAAALDRSIRNVRTFHRDQLPTSTRWLEVEPGVWCGDRWTPIDSVALYVPRGRGAFSSVACMLGVPAALAGVKNIVMFTPPGEDGTVDAATLYVCQQLGIDQIVRIGGAQAVAAAAFGTSSVPTCQKIVGPGNVYVSAARRILNHKIDPGPPAGPSESLIICDESVDAENAAWNLLIEAEHGENSTALLLIPDMPTAERIRGCVDGLLDQLSERRREFVKTVLSDRGGIVVTESMDQSIEIANKLAVEHVAVMVRNPWEVHPRITNAGEILFGDFPIVSLANYAMGVNAIIPTGGRAKTTSPVSMQEFGKFTALGFCTAEGKKQLEPIVSAFSRDEGFSAHHLAVENWRIRESEGR
ncbi:MAG: histidinol dehydrogenase [Phycisphaerae bacterium]